MGLIPEWERDKIREEKNSENVKKAGVENLGLESEGKNWAYRSFIVIPDKNYQDPINRLLGVSVTLPGGSLQKHGFGAHQKWQILLEIRFFHIIQNLCCNRQVKL